MNSLIKKLFLIITVLVLSFGITVSAEEPVSLNLPNEFFIHSKNPQKVADIFNMDATSLTDYCVNNNIMFLAVDSKNTKQIRITVSENEFSNKISNISNMSDDKITYLAPDITGIPDVKGEAVNLNGQKFLLVQTKSKDSGGEYILTQYITVAEKQNVVLSFYNSASTDTDYTEEVFKSFTSPMFINNKPEAKINIMLILVPIAFIVFLIACVGLAVSVLLDIKKHKEKYEEMEEYEESEELENNKPEPDANN